MSALHPLKKIVGTVVSSGMDRTVWSLLLRFDYYGGRCLAWRVLRHDFLSVHGVGGLCARFMTSGVVGVDCTTVLSSLNISCIDIIPCPFISLSHQLALIPLVCMRQTPHSYFLSGCRAGGATVPAPEIPEDHSTGEQVSVS